MSVPQHGTDIREYVGVLKNRKFEVGLITSVVLAAALALTFRQVPQYAGQAKVLVKPFQSFGATTTQIAQAPNLDTERELILSQAIAQVVRDRLVRPIPVDTLLANVHVAVVSDTEVLLIAYDSPSPATAAAAANAFADAYVGFRSRQALDQFDTAAAAMEQRIEGLRANLADVNRKIDATTDQEALDGFAADRDTLVAQMGVMQSRLLDLQSTASTVGQSGQVIQRASIPRSPVSPNKVRDGVLGLFAGLFLGVGFAFLRERLDDGIRSREELEERMGAPVMAVVPKVPGWRRREVAHLVMRADPKSPVAEAYRTLGTNLQYLASREDLKVIMITSSLGGEGKTTTSANIAVTLAQAGKRVILISADLRKPRIHRFFAMRNDIGLATVLQDASTDLAEVAKDPGIPNLRVVCGGPTPKSPAELLAGRRCRDFIGSLRSVSDFIIIDTPPVLAVADASILAALSDGTLFLVDGDRTKRSAMQQSRAQLENAGARVIGVVYNNFDPTQNASYPYHYSYAEYASESPREHARNGDANGHGARSRGGRRNRAPAVVGFERSGIEAGDRG